MPCEGQTVYDAQITEPGSLGRSSAQPCEAFVFVRFFVVMLQRLPIIEKEDESFERKGGMT